MSIFLSSGEASGDHYTASVAKTLRKMGYEGDIWGMGGKEPKEAGVRVEWPGEELQLFGIAEVLSSVPKLFRLLNEMTDRIMQRGPQSVVIADSPDFNIRLVQKLRSKGYKGRVFYISPPSVWAWRRGRVKKIAAVVEEFSDKEALAANLPESYRDDRMLIGFLPGSRGVEVRNLLPVMEKAASGLRAMGWRPVFSIAPGLHEREKMKMTERLQAGNFDVYTGQGRDLLAASCCSVAASGTVAVEAMMLGSYMVAAYRLSPLSAFLARRLVKTPYYTIPNILLDMELFPELMQEEATEENILKEVLKWLNGDDKTKKYISQKMDLAREMLGETGVYELWARRIMGAA